MRKQFRLASASTIIRGRWLAPFCIVWLGVFSIGCQPVMPDDYMLHPEKQQSRPVPAHEALGSADLPPLPEITWSDPPSCESQNTDSGQDQSAICAVLIYRTGTESRELIWSDDIILQQSYPLADVPEGITSYSPDFTRLVVQTPQGHTAGGPLYLYNLETEQLFNLNEETGLPSNTGVSALRVVGWHPDSQQLLLANEDDEVTIWLDLNDGSYRALALGIDVGEMAPPRRLLLAPDGSGFTFETRKRETGNRETQANYLYWYDLATNETRLLLTVPSTQGQLVETAISPDGNQVAYVLHKGSRSQGRSEEIYLLDIGNGDSSGVADGTSNSRLLLSGNIGPTVPVWSPDGEHIAMVQRDLSEPLRTDPRQPPPLGDIWTISIDSGEASQLTFTEALNRPPVWSLDGRYLAFVTEDGQIGMVSTADPGVIWQLDNPSLSPEFIQIAFAPMELVR